MTRTTLITGSASGIGAEAARLLRAADETVIGIDLHDAEIEADLSTAEGRQAAVQRALELSGGSIDAVIASAGISAPVGQTCAINYFGVVDVLEALRPTLATSQAPRAVVVSSMATLMPVSPELVDAMLAGDEARAIEIGDAFAAQGPQMGFLNYSSSKRALSRWVRRESITPAWAGAHIPLNAVAPCIVITPMTEDLLKTDESRQGVDTQVPMPLNYHMPATAVADLLIWLTSVDNTHVTGQTIYADGGSDAVLRGDDIWSWND